MFDSLFAFFFKYSPYVFEQGELRLALSSPVYIAVALAAAAALATVLTYRSAPGDASWLDRAVLITLRLCLVGLVLFCLFRPVLILRAAGPAAELPRHPPGRLAQHARRRPRRASREASSSARRSRPTARS